MKFCKDCEYNQYAGACCTRRTKWVKHVVTGRVMPTRPVPFAEVERRPIRGWHPYFGIDRCGPEARYFVPAAPKIPPQHLLSPESPHKDAPL